MLVLVSLPCLNDFALQENELDAAATLRLLARELERREEAPQGSRIEELASRSAVLRELTDAEFLDGGRLLRRHGYLFSLVPCAGALPPPGPGVVLAGPPAASPGGSALVAWPWSHGRTGHTALVAHPQGGVLGHPNLEGSWSGLEHPPVGFCSGADGWRPLR